MNPLAVIPDGAVSSTLWSNFAVYSDAIRETYLDDKYVNPESVFLRFDREIPSKRAIALPASSGSAVGIKWVSSVPSNLQIGLPRASASILLNSFDTGRALALVAGSEISLFRTAVSAVILAQAALNGNPGEGVRLAIVGCGELSARVVRVLDLLGWPVEEIRLLDLDHRRSIEFREKLIAADASPSVTIGGSVRDVFEGATIGLFATSASSPYVSSQDLGECNAIIHLSLRDLLPDILAEATNIVDLYSHATREKTSLGLACELGIVDEKRVIEARSLLSGAFAPVDAGNRFVISPFGLGVLDVVLAWHVFEALRSSDEVDFVPFG